MLGCQAGILSHPHVYISESIFYLPADSLSLRNFDFRIQTLYTCLDFGSAFGIARLAIDAACPAAAVVHRSLGLGAGIPKQVH